ELRDQLLLPFARRRVAGAVAALQRATLLLADRGEVGALRLGVDVLADRARGDVAVHAGGHELAPHTVAAELLLHARPRVRGGEALVIKPLLVAQAGQRGLDGLGREPLRRQFAAQLRRAVEAIAQDAQRRDVAGVRIVGRWPLAVGRGFVVHRWPS